MSMPQLPRRPGRQALFVVLTLVLGLAFPAAAPAQAAKADPLPSWNDGPVKQSIVGFVSRVDHVNDKEGKPVGNDLHIGRSPVFVAGNVRSGGDIAMLGASRQRRGPSFQLLIHHDDAAREFAYEEKDGASLRAAKEGGWTVVSMRDDWKTVFRGTP